MKTEKEKLEEANALIRKLGEAVKFAEEWFRDFPHDKFSDEEWALLGDAQIVYELWKKENPE